MSTDTLADLFAELPPRLLARRQELEDFQLGRLCETQAAKLRSEAETDEDLDYALMLFEPFDAVEMQGIEDLVQVALPEPASAEVSAPALVLHQGGAALTPAEPAVTSLVQPLSRRPWYAGFAAAAAALIGVASTQSGPGFEMTGSGVQLATTGQVLQYTLRAKPLRSLPTEVVVVAVAGTDVHRTRVRLTDKEVGTVLEAPVQDIAGRLAGTVQLLVLPTSHGLAEDMSADEVRALIASADSGASTQLRIQPPTYALAARAEGTVLGGHEPATVTASTTVPVPGQLILNFRPATRTGGDLDLRILVVRPGAQPQRLKAQIKAKSGVYEIRAQGVDLFAEHDRAMLQLFVGPADAPLPSTPEACSAPWRCVSHEVIRE